MTKFISDIKLDKIQSGYEKVVTTCLLIKMIIEDLKNRREKIRRIEGEGSKEEKGRKIGKVKKGALDYT